MGKFHVENESLEGDKAGQNVAACFAAKDTASQTEDE